MKMRSIRVRRGTKGGLAVLLVLAASSAVPPLAAAAVTITVNTTADNAPGPGQCEGAAGDCSLRQAIDVANGEPGADTVVLPAGEYDLTIEPAGGTPGDSGDLNVGGELTIDGAGARKSVIDASAIEDRVLELEDGGELTLVGLGVTGGSTSENGGGIYSENGKLALEGVAVTNNKAFDSGYGGGIELEEGTLTILDSVLSGNQNSGDGGAIYAPSSDLLRIENSTVADNVVNTALYPGNPGWGAYGGAMEVEGETLVLKSDTIAGNQIIDGNGGEEGRGAALVADFENYEVANTIIADNTGTEVEDDGQCSETLESLGHNLETQAPAGEPRCFEAPTDLIADPMLGTLANNGGETDTMALPAGSAAIDAGDPALCPPTDQRGVARPVGNGCDIGAFEFAPTPPQKPATPPSPAGGWFGIKSVKHNLSKGTAKLGIQFTGSGEVTVKGKGIRPVARQASSGLSYVPLVPAKSLRARLMQTGRVKVKVTVSFKTAANVWTKTKVVTIRLKK
jgi:hypothetical protein